MLGHKTSLTKFKNTEILSNLFSNHNNMKPEINQKKKTSKNTNTWKVNMLLNQKQFNEEIKTYKDK